MKPNKPVDLLAKLHKAFGQNSKSLRPKFPLKPECIGHDVVFIPTDDIDGFFQTKQDYERRFGCPLISDLTNDEKALVTAITGGLSPTSIRDFLIKRCGYDAVDVRSLDWDAIIRIIRDYRERQSTEKVPLGETAELIYKKLLSLPEHKGMIAREICDWLGREHRIILSESTIYKEYKPQLEPYGLMHKKRVGFYIRKQG